MTLVLEAAAPPIIAADIRRYSISDRFEVKANCRSFLQIWCPIIVDTPYQRVLDINVAAPQPWRLI